LLVQPSSPIFCHGHPWWGLADPATGAQRRHQGATPFAAEFVAVPQPRGPAEGMLMVWTTALLS